MDIQKKQIGGSGVGGGGVMLLHTSPCSHTVIGSRLDIKIRHNRYCGHKMSV